MRESDRDAALLGRIAVKHRFITMEQLAEATRIRGQHGRKLGAVLVELGMIDELQLGKILALQARHLKQLQSRVDREGSPPAAQRLGRLKKIPTPKDWVFQVDEEAGHRPRRAAAPMPRRGRRTADAHPEAMAAEVERRRHRTAPDGALGGARGHRPAREHASEAPSSEAVEQPVAEAAHRRAATRPEIESPVQVAAARPSAARPTPVDGPRHDARDAEDGDRAPMGRELDEGVGDDALEIDLPQEEDTALELERDQAAVSTTPDPVVAPTKPSGPSEAPPTRPRSTPPSADPGAASPASSELAPVTDREPPTWPELEPRRRGDAPPVTKAVSDLHRFLEAAASHSASDIHVHAGQPLKMRQFGRLVPISDQPLSPAATERVLRELLSPWQRGQLDEHGEVDFAYTVEDVGRFRANVYIHHSGVNGVFHFVPPRPPTLDELGLPTSLARLTNYSQGLILVTGPAGCGKTSTLAALVDIINAERNDHILTIEDPIEYLHPSKRCVVNQRQVGRHTTSFARALRGALREDPDIICIGELRDLETISLALSAAETGHLVLATLHTGSSIGTINRIVGAYPPNQQPQVRAMMSESLRAIISQRLVPRTDGAGVVPALEVLYVNKAVGKCIRDNRTFQINSVLQTGKAQGMQRLDDALSELVARGVITDEAAREHGTEGGS